MHPFVRCTHGCGLHTCFLKQSPILRQIYVEFSRSCGVFTFMWNIARWKFQKLGSLRHDEGANHGEFLKAAGGFVEGNPLPVSVAGAMLSPLHIPKRNAESWNQRYDERNRKNRPVSCCSR